MRGERACRPATCPTSKAERATFVLSDKEILTLARWACTIERHYGMPDGYGMGQGRQHRRTVHRPGTSGNRAVAPRSQRFQNLHGSGKKGRILTTGLSLGDAAVAGRLASSKAAKDIDEFIDGSILVTDTTDPDWVPIMKRAAAIITDQGGRTSHAAIVSRELGLASNRRHGQCHLRTTCRPGRHRLLCRG